MLQINIKRIKHNKSVTHGILTMPEYDFRCRTIELANGKDLLYKQGCCVNTGTYVLSSTISESSYFIPCFKRKPVGFFKKPKFVFYGLDYLHLETGNIGLGVDPADEFSINQSSVLREKALEIFAKHFRNREIVVLQITQSKNFEYEDISFYEAHKTLEVDLDFLENSEDIEDE